MKIQNLAASAALVIVSVAAAAPAVAQTWGSSAHPVYGYEDGDPFGKLYGSFYNSNSVSAMSTTWQYDLQPGGNTVRVETDFAWRRLCSVANETPSWCPDVSKQTDETNSAKWHKHSRARNLRWDADAARGSVDICEIQRWHNDPCSAPALPKFEY